MNGQIIFILWRESIEALLVIGILAGWLAHQNARVGGRRCSCGAALPRGWRWPWALR